jgi:hypothetical protein
MKKVPGRFTAQILSAATENQNHFRPSSLSIQNPKTKTISGPLIGLANLATPEA